MPIDRTVLRKYPNTIFVETGTYLGDTTALALDCGFEHVLTVELSNTWRDQYQTRFGNDPCVQLFAGLSKDRLPEMLAQIDAPATFWLDAHYSIEPHTPTALGDKFCPLLDELDLIAGHWIKTHTILIDDVRLFGQEFGSDVTIERVKEKLRLINPSYHFHFEDGYVPNDILVAVLPQAQRASDPWYGHPPAATVTAYPLYAHAVPLRPAAEARTWTPAQATVSANLGGTNINWQGWQVLCPAAFEATWNGGPAPEDIAIRIEAVNAETPPFVQSCLGGGRLTVHTGYQLQTTGADSLWVRGPINWPKDGLYPLEQIVDTSPLPGTITVIWQCMRPHQTVRFEQGEPFGVLLPYPQHYRDQCKLDVIDPEDALETYEREFQQRIQAPTMQDVLLRLQQGKSNLTAQG